MSKLKVIVVDASVAIKWFSTEEQDIQLATHLYQNHLENKETIIIPDLLLIEFANALVTKSNSQPSDIAKALRELLEANLHIHKITPNEILSAAKLAKKYKTSVYDMLYAVVAKVHKTLLITADNGFISRTNFHFVKHIQEMA